MSRYIVYYDYFALLLRQRERLSASVVSICSSVCLSPKCKKMLFSQKVSNLELYGVCLRPILDYWIEPIIVSLKSTTAEIRYLENRHDAIFFCRGWSDLDKISETGAEWHVDCGDWSKSKADVEFQYGGRFGEWHVISEPRITLQGAATLWIYCQDSRATCHITGCKNSIRHIKNLFSPYFNFFLFLMQFRLRRAAAFVSYPIHLFIAIAVWWTKVNIKLQWKSNRKSHSSFRLVPISMTLNDLERP